MPSPTKALPVSADIRPPRTAQSRGGTRPYTSVFIWFPIFR